MNWWLLVIVLLLPAFMLGGDVGTSPSIQEVKRKHETKLMALSGVVSVGIGRDQAGNPAIIVGLDGPRPETEAQLPRHIEGFPVVIQIVGPIKAH